MSAYLLDTNVILRGFYTPERLSHSIRSRLKNGERFLSVLSYWEIVLKSMIGKLDVGDPRVFWAEALDRLAATPVPLRPEHVAAIYSLDPIHQDPFDRALIAQAKAEALILVTMDKHVRRYGVQSLYAGL